MSQGVEFRVGTASWTDPGLIESGTFYPPSLKTAEGRLRFYASHFDTVEVDSSYYALPSEKNSRLWVDRTPEEFIFNIKAFAWLTQHPAETVRLPNSIKQLLTAAERSAPTLRAARPEPLELAFKMFHSALGPLRDGEKLGMVLFQFPPYFTYRAANFDYLASLEERLPSTRIAIELRHPSWIADASRRGQTMGFLRDHGLVWVCIDAPVAPSIAPSLLEATGAEGYVRFHGKNREAWFKRKIGPAERYKYLYSERELEPWVGKLKGLGAKGVKRAYVIFNNCYRNFGIMNATTMKNMLSH